MNIHNYSEEITTYAEFDEIVVKPFFQSRYHSVIVVGRPGLGKSQVFAARLNEYSHLIKGMQKEAMALLDEVIPAGNNSNHTKSHQVPMFEGGKN